MPLCVSAQAQDIFEFPQPENNPEEFCVVTEIPAGGMIGYEADAKTDFVAANCFQSIPVAYPANYGSLIQSLTGDGDPLNAILYTRTPLAPGTLIKLCATDVPKMIDDGEKDDKIVAVSTNKVSPIYGDIRKLNGLPKIEVQRLKSFFRVYKDLPEGYKKVELNGFNDAVTAKQGIKQVWDTWEEKKPQ